MHHPRMNNHDNTSESHARLIAARERQARRLRYLVSYMLPDAYSQVVTLIHGRVVQLHDPSHHFHLVFVDTSQEREDYD